MRMVAFEVLLFLKERWVGLMLEVLKIVDYV